MTERTIGGLDVFLPYVNDYVNTFTGKSITTQQWKDHLYAFFEKNGGPEKIKALDSIDWNASVYALGFVIVSDIFAGVVLWRGNIPTRRDGV